MEELNSIKHICLGMDPSKFLVLQCLDSVCNTFGSSNQDSRTTLIPMSRYNNSLDYMKLRYRKKIDNTTEKIGDVDESSQKKLFKRKLFTIRSRDEENKDSCTYCFAPLLDQQFSKASKSQDVIKWFSKKLVATDYVAPAKIARLEISIEPAVFYASSTFYKSRGSFTLDRTKITCQIYFKDWYTIEVSSSRIKRITVFPKRNLIKITVRTKIIEEISNLCIKYEPCEKDIIKTMPKKPLGMADVMLFFINKPILKTDYDQMVEMYGSERMVWNESDSDTKDIIENVFYKHQKLKELTMKNNPLNWSTIFNEENNLKAKIKTPSPGAISKIQKVSSISINIPNFNVTSPNTSTSTKFHAIPNIINKKRIDSSNISNSQSQPISISKPSTSVDTVNNSEKPIQTVINLPAFVNTDKTESSIMQSASLMYVPNRNLGNIFETFHYNPSLDSNVLIHGSDLLCLNTDQFLNDNIINFYLNYIYYEIMTADQRRRTHLFNVFFSTKLRGSSTNTFSNTPELRHANVSKWTKKVDIFDKDFIIIPMNESKHWFVAIVCFPWMAGVISYDKLFGVVPLQSKSQIPLNNSSFVCLYRKQRMKYLEEQYGVSAKPCILLFDSLQFESRAPSVQLIREYLKTEWDSKRLAKDGPLAFDKNTIRGFNPQVPRQTNASDCGIFALHYVEQFFSKPLKVFTKEFFQSSLLSWFENETVSKKRAFIQQMVLQKADEYSKIRRSDNSCISNTKNDDSDTDIQLL